MEIGDIYIRNDKYNSSHLSYIIIIIDISKEYYTYRTTFGSDEHSTYRLLISDCDKYFNRVDYD